MHVTTYHYDPNQNPDQVTDANGSVSSNVYDADNELTQAKRADSPQTTLTTDYNADGTLLDEKDGKGNAIVTFGYNSRGERTTATDGPQ
jgi:YD repeat-containing protein